MPHYREWDPPARLQQRVERFWVSSVASAAPVVHRVLPDGCADIIYTRANGRSKLLFVGPMTKFEDYEQAPGAVSVAMRFLPAMWSDVVGIDGRDTTDGSIELEALMGRRAAELHRRLDTARTLREQVQMLAFALPGASVLSPVQQSIRALALSHGALSVDDLAASAALSGRQFRRKCIRLTALSPKLLARILRFRHAHTLLRRFPVAADLALACGYSDQSHMIAEFRAFSGRTPRAYR